MHRTLALLVLAAAGCGNDNNGNGGDGGAPDLSVIVDHDLAMAKPTQSVTMHHKNPSRDGLYVDAALTRAAIAGLHKDPGFSAKVNGPTYAQALFLDGAGAGKDMVIAATEQNEVTAFDASGGAQLWTRKLGTPVKLGNLPCGNINTLGVTGTPIVDEAARTLYVDGMTTDDGGTTKKHRVFALDVGDGTVRAGWPVDVNAAISQPHAFASAYQNQRGALALVGGTLYVPYGGHWGDCGTYYGWVVGVPTATPANAKAWATRASGGGIWAPSGPSSDGTHLFVVTGNTFTGNTWMDGEAVIRLAAGPAFTEQAADYLVPSDWKALDDADVDLSGTGPVLVDVPGATPSQLVVALGKDGKIYLGDRNNLGGIGGALTVAKVANDEIINAAAAYRTAQGSYVVFKGNGTDCPNGAGDLVAVRIGAANPPTVKTAWCASMNGMGSPAVSTSDGMNDAIVWAVGAEGDNRLHGFDGDTGAELFAGGGANDGFGPVHRYVTPIVAKGRIFVAADQQVAAFTVK